MENELRTRFTSSVKPDICGMSSGEIEKKADSILRIIARLIKEAMTKYGTKALAAVVFFVNVANLAVQVASYVD